MIRDKQGHMYSGLTELQLLMEVDKITNPGAEQLTEQDQLVGAEHEQEEITEDQQGIAANKVYDRSLASGPTLY